jgi:hypothetical protein
MNIIQSQLCSTLLRTILACLIQIKLVGHEVTEGDVLAEDILIIKSSTLPLAIQILERQEKVGNPWRVNFLRVFFGHLLLMM